MDIKRLQKNWDELGKTDPLWAILTHPDKKGNRWEIGEFFKTGESEIGRIMEYAESLDANLQRFRALDFGCGIGRLSQPLCQYFEEVYGVDIAFSMINLAKKYNKHEDKCHYYLNERSDLKIFPDNHFDFIYSVITLQHISPEYSKNYIKEFIRILRPNGLLIFQLPHKIKVVNLKTLFLHIAPKVLIELFNSQVKYRSKPKIDMYEVKRNSVIEIIKSNGAKIVKITEDQSAGRERVSYRYCVTKE